MLLPENHKVSLSAKKSCLQKRGDFRQRESGKVHYRRSDVVLQVSGHSRLAGSVFSPKDPADPSEKRTPNTGEVTDSLKYNHTDIFVMMYLLVVFQ